MLRQILFLSSSCLTVYHQTGRHLERIGCYVGADAGLAYFDTYLQRFAHVPALVLTDLVEEDFRVDSIAHALGGDRRALLERHVSRLYRGTDYRYSQVLGRDPKNKRKDEVLFSGLLNPEFADMWLEAMNHHKVPIIGIYSLPLISIRLLKRIWNIRKDVLFVTHNLTSGLRQTFFSQGQMRFSRLTPVPDDLEGQGYAQFIHSEIGKTKRYLSNLHLLGRDVVLDVCMPSGGEHLTALQAMRSREELTHYHFHDVQILAEKLKYRGVSNEYCDELFVYSLAKHRHRNHYANDHHRYHYRLHAIRQGLALFSIATIISGVLWSGMQVSDALLYRKHTLETQNLLAEAESRYAELQTDAATSQVAAIDIQLAVETAERLQQQRRTPRTVMSNFGQTLLRHPGLQVTQLDWFVSGDPNAVAIGADTDSKEQSEAEFDIEGNLVETPTADNNLQIGILRGQVTPFDGNYARAHRRIEDLVIDLRRLPGIHSVDALELPLNITSSGQVTGGIGGDSTRPDAMFSIRLVLGERHAQL